MKFFFGLVSCCGPSATSRSRTSSTTSPGTSADETRSLVMSSSSRQQQISRKRSVQARSASAEWKPSLRSISEVKVVTEKRPDERTIGSDRAVKRKSTKTGPDPASSRTHVRSVSDDYE